MRCDELMKRDVECVGMRDTVQQAARRMRDANVGFIPVCDEKFRVLGTLTDRDIAIRLVSDNRPATTEVKEIMSREVVSCRPTDDLERAQRIMAERQKSRLLVIDQHDKLVGVLSLSDIIERTDAVRAAQTLQSVASREAHA